MVQKEPGPTSQIIHFAKKFLGLILRLETQPLEKVHVFKHRLWPAKGWPKAVTPPKKRAEKAPYLKKTLKYEENIF